MKFIVGLGNPGKEYEKTRHNLGFMALDYLAKKYETVFEYNKKFDADIAEMEIGGEKTLLAKPQTFMNNSGEAIKKIIDFYKIPISDVAIIYDDIDLPIGEMKRAGKSSAGHKGAESIFETLGTNEINRYRLGIKGDQGYIPTDKYVLQKFTDKELKAIKVILTKIIVY